MFRSSGRTNLLCPLPNRFPRVQTFSSTHSLVIPLSNHNSLLPSNFRSGKTSPQGSRILKPRPIISTPFLSSRTIISRLLQGSGFRLRNRRCIPWAPILLVLHLICLSHLLRRWTLVCNKLQNLGLLVPLQWNRQWRQHLLTSHLVKTSLLKRSCQCLNRLRWKLVPLHFIKSNDLI